MRIAIDLQGAQSLGSSKRGIGRYSIEIINHLLEYFPQNEYILMANGCLLDISYNFRKYIKCKNVSYINWYSPAPLDYISKNENSFSIARYLRSYAFNCVFPDVILVTSFFEGFTDNCFTEFDKDILEKPVLSIFYDLIPLIHPNLYLNSNQSFSGFYLNKIKHLKELDGLLSISSSSRKEAIKYLGFVKEKIYNISSACNTKIFNTKKVVQEKVSRVNLDSLDQFILYSGASDPRKNVKGLLEAYSKLSWDLRLNYKLVLAGKLLEIEIDQIKCWINEFNIRSNSLVLLGYVSDSDLVKLYQNCALFVFPSFHEGFGLPILEAMSCGAPVIGSNSTSIPEIIGDTRAMFDPYDSESIKKLIDKALTDKLFKSFLLENSIVQAQKFSWVMTVKKILKACEKIINGRLIDYSNYTWEEISTKKEEKYNKLLAKVRSYIDNNPSLDQEFISQVASSIDLIEFETDFILRSLTSQDLISSWKVEGPFDSNYSLSILNKNFVLALDKIIDNVSIHITEGLGDYIPDIKFLKKYPDIYDLYKKSFDSCSSSTITSRNLYPPRVVDLKSRINLLHSYGWEESEFPQEWVEDFNTYLQGISVMSFQVKKILIDNGVRISISVCGLGIDHLDHIENNTNYSTNAKKFKFLHVSSCFPRKGIDVLLAAYGEAFDASDDVSLIIKTFKNPHNNIEELLKQHQYKNPKYPHVIIINEDLSNSELKNLYLSSDVLVAPSRGEGFGLPIAEAMLLDLPVITTGWGGQTDFCNVNNSWLIDYEFTSASSHFDLGMSYWAEPSCDHLKELMQDIFKMKRDDLTLKIAQAKQDIKKYSWQDMALKNVRFSEYISKNINRNHPIIGWISSWETRCGIAAYSKNLIENIHSRVNLFTPLLSKNSSTKYETIQCWELDNGRSQDLSNLYNSILNKQITSLVIQFNYGFFDFLEFSKFIEKLALQKINIILFMHSTSDPKDSNNKCLNLLVSSLAKCSRILVHTITDLNRLKSLGLIENVALFPHGIKQLGSNLEFITEKNNMKLLTKKNKLKIASYGFCLPNKGFQELIKAVKILSEKNIDFELNLFTAIYSDSYAYVYHELIDLVNRLKLRNWVNINTEYMSEERTLRSLSAQDLIVFPYQFTNESSSASVRQALVALRPTLVTPNPIFNDIADCVEFLPGYTAQQISKGIIDWLSRSKKNNQETQIIHNKKQKFIQNFEFSKLGRRLENIIHSLELNS